MTDKSYRNGKALYLFPRTAEGKEFYGYKYSRTPIFAQQSVFISVSKCTEEINCIKVFTVAQFLQNFLQKCSLGENGCSEQDRLTRASELTLRRTLRFRPEVLSRARGAFDEVSRRTGLPGRKIFFVGVHNRRTDHVDYHRRKAKRGPLKADYFRDAFQAYR